MPPAEPVPKTTIRRHILGGITRANWSRLLRENDIDPPYRARARKLGWVTRLNSIAAAIERARFSRRIAATPLPERPLFVLGSWRSGTTYLHQLLAQDPRFGIVTTLDAIFPESSLVMRGLVRGGARKRPMDNVTYGPATPNEDEFAIAGRSLRSPFLGYAFPRRSEHYDRYLSLRDVSGQERREWADALRMTLRKAVFSSGRGELLLKSPPHTARVGHLLALFPKARFVMVHRHPHHILRSLLGLHDSMGELSYLQTPAPEELAAAALRRYRLMFEAYFADRGSVPPGQLIEVPFDELQRDAMGVVERTYAALGVEMTPEARARLTAYAESRRDYQRNVHAPLAPGLAERLAPAAARSMTEWGYR